MRGNFASGDSMTRRAPEDAQSAGRQYVAYYRVSSPGQGASGLSLAGQTDTVHQFVDERGGKLVAAFSERRSGLKSAGKQLREALRTCRMRRAILIVAAIDRLSRRAALIAAIMDSDIELVVADSPDTERVVLHVKAAWAEQESVQMSARIKAALAEAKKRGKKPEGPETGAIVCTYSKRIGDAPPPPTADTHGPVVEKPGSKKELQPA